MGRRIGAGASQPVRQSASSRWKVTVERQSQEEWWVCRESRASSFFNPLASPAGLSHRPSLLPFTSFEFWLSAVCLFYLPICCLCCCGLVFITCFFYVTVCCCYIYYTTQSPPAAATFMDAESMRIGRREIWAKGGERLYFVNFMRSQSSVSPNLQTIKK
jgi:hypothetical protein